MRKIFLVPTLMLMYVLTACGASRADIVYTTEDGTSRSLGGIEVEGAESIDISKLSPIKTGLKEGARVSAFWGNQQPRVLLTEPGASDGDAAYIYTPNNWEEEPSEQTLTGTLALRGASASRQGNSLFTASQSCLTEYSASSYAPTGRVYICTEGDRITSGEDVLVNGTVIYGLFSVREPESDGPYLSSKLVLLDGQLNEQGRYDNFNVGPQAVALAATSDGKIAVAYRGEEDWKGGIDLCYRGALSHLISGDVSGDQYGAIPTLCSDGDSGLYFVGQKQVGGIAPVNTLYRWKSDGTFSAIPSGEASSSFVKVAWDDTHKLLAMATAEKIVVFQDDTVLRTFTSADLGGTVTSMAATIDSGSSDESSSSNCGALSLGSAALLAPLTLLCGKKARSRVGGR